MYVYTYTRRERGRERERESREEITRVIYCGRRRFSSAGDFCKWTFVARTSFGTKFGITVQCWRLVLFMLQSWSCVVKNCFFNSFCFGGKKSITEVQAVRVIVCNIL